MRLVEMHESSVWDTIVQQTSATPLTQSWAWGVLQESVGRAVKRYALYDGSSLLACVLFVRREGWPLGYWFAPRGPVLTKEGTARVRETLDALLKGSLRVLPGLTLFVRVEPALTMQDAAGCLPLIMRRTQAMNPACTRRIDLTQGWETLCSQMHQKTRYSIRIAGRQGIEVRIGSSEDLDTFLDLMQETAVRQRVQFHERSYLAATYHVLARAGLARLRLAEKNGKLLAGSMEIRFGDTISFLHGCSSSTHREYMAPYAIHAMAIREGQQSGAHWYDFVGCNPERLSSPHYRASWEGISRFKKGWGGELVEWLGTWDLPLNRLFYACAFPRSVMR